MHATAGFCHTNVHVCTSSKKMNETIYKNILSENVSSTDTCTGFESNGGFKRK